MTAAQQGMRKVIVCDDDPTRVMGWANRLREILGADQFEVESLSPGEFANAVGALHARLRASKGHEQTVGKDDASRLDGADILIIDSDLTPDPHAEVDPGSEQAIDDNLVGEYGSNVARLARAYSTAGVLVVVNHIYKQRTFDLTMTRFADLPADAYITALDIDNVGLWTGIPDGGFRPWSWPNLSAIRPPDGSMLPGSSLESTVLESIGLEASDSNLIDDKQWERLSFDVATPSDITLRDVAMSPSFGIGPLPDASAEESQLLRVAKSGIRRWLEHVVLPSQNVFVDLPHLLQDRPWLAAGARRNPEALASLVGGSWEGDQGIAPEAFAPDATALVGRAIWRVDRLSYPESSDRLAADDLVFCEDTSDFRLPSDARDFESDILGQFRSRFVARLEGVEYTPLRRLFA